jgi:hypothetical protein
MANGFGIRDQIKDSVDGVACAASSTTAITNNFGISAEDSKAIEVAVDFSSMEEVTGITVALQDSYDGGTTWENVKSATAVTTVAKVDTLTFPAKASATASDYFVIYDSGGDAWACALDVTGSDTAPTGALWAAIPAGRKVQADISGDTTAAQVAASVEAAFDALTDVGNEFTTDDTAADGTMTFTWVRKGNDSTATSEQTEDDSGSGSISIANTTAGSFTVPEINNSVYNGTDAPAWPLCRVVVITDTSDACTASKVYVSQRR